MSPKAKLLVVLTASCVLSAGGRAEPGATPRRAVPAVPPSVGKSVFAKWCGDCHSTLTGPGTMALQRKYNGETPAVLEQRADLNADYVAQVVRHGVSFMPSFRKTEISDAELALVGAYLASPMHPTPPARRAKRR